MTGRVDYSQEVLCRHCDERHLKINVKVIPNWGYQCPDCGRKCRTKVSYNRETWLLKHPKKVKFNTRGISIKTDILNAKKEGVE